MILKSEKYPEFSDTIKKGEKMKKTMILETKDNKIIISYFRGDRSELFINPKKGETRWDYKAIDKIFGMLIIGIDKAIKEAVMKIGVDLEQRKIGKQVFDKEKTHNH